MAKLNDLIVTGDTKMLGKLHANADTATTASNVFDSGNKSLITFNYSADGVSNPTWLAGWNGYELRGVPRSSLHVGTADKASYLTSQGDLVANTRTQAYSQAVLAGGWANDAAGFGSTYGTVLDISGYSSWYHRLAFHTSGEIDYWIGINTTTLTKKGRFLTSANYSSYALPLSGGTMTGVLKLKGSMYEDSFTSGALDAQNSNITGVNSIYTADLADSASEGIHFYRTATTVDSLWAKNGVLYFSPNRTVGSGTSTDNTILHSANYNSYALPLAGGTLTGTLTIGSSTQSASPGIGIHVHDLRSATINPGTFGDKQVNFYFKQITDGFGGSDATKWMSIMHVKGWTGSYAAWELAGNADNSSANDTLRYRQGKDTTWGAWQSILTDANFTTYLNGTYIRGSGTANKVPKFTEARVIGSSNITDDGSTITLGTKVVIQGNGSSYNEGLRILPASNGWSNIFFSADTSVQGTHNGGWLIGRRGAAGAVSGAIGDFTIEEENSTGVNLTIHKDSGGATLQGKFKSDKIELKGAGTFASTSNYANALIFMGSRNNNQVTARNYYPWLGGQDGVNGQGYINTIALGAFHGAPSDAGFYVGMSWDGNNSDTFYYFSRSGTFEAPRAAIGGYNNTSYALSTNSFICNSWIRTVGATGWYNESYGGGWYMTDATYIRNYNSKQVLLNALLTTSSGATHAGVKVGDVYVNAINGHLILQNLGQLRFGADAWDYNQWAGLKYDSSSKYIYLGLADGTIFTANTAQSGGRILTPGISYLHVGNQTTYYMDSSGNINGNVITANSRLATPYIYTSTFSVRDNKTKNWYRIWSGSGSNTGNTYCVFTLSRSYNSPQNEQYTFAVSVGYNGDINITQLSGVQGSPLITKIRVVYKNSGNVYIDFYANANSSYSNTYYVSGYGYGHFQTPAIISTLDSGFTAYEFTPGAGVKSSGPIGGSRIFAGYDSGQSNSISCSNWFRSSGDTGWYNNDHGCHVRPNTVGSYGSIRVHGGAKGGYEGIHFGAGKSGMTVMSIDGSHQGLYNEAAGKWIIYYSGGGSCVGIGTSSLDSGYSVTMGSTYVAGALYATGLIYSASSSRTLTIGSQNTSYCHYSTNADVGHWFNKNTYVQGDIYAGASYNQKVLHAGNYSSYALPLSGGTMSGNITLGTYGILGFGNTIPATHKEVTSFTPEANAVWLATTGGGSESSGICLDGSSIKFWTPNDSVIEFLDSDTSNGTGYASVKFGTVSGGTWNGSAIGVAYGGTGVTSWTANRVLYASAATTLSYTSHYVSSTKMAINSTSEPSYTFYVSGTSYFSGAVTITGTLALTKTQDASATANNNPALIIGGSNSAAHIEIDNNEIIAKSNGTTQTTLYIQDTNGVTQFGGQVKAPSFNATSDMRLKTNLRLFKHGDVFDLPVYKFDFIAGEKNKIGCMAQDLQQICPEIVHQGEDGYLTIEESKIVYLLLDKMKEMQAEINVLKEGK